MGIIYKSSPIPFMEILCCTDSFEFKPHIHDKYVVWLNTGCGEHYTANGSSSILQMDSISIFEPGLVHSNYACSDTQRCLRSFYLDPEFFHNLAARNGGQKQDRYFKKNSIKDTGLWGRLARLHDLILKSPPDLEIDTHVLNIFLSLMDRNGIQPFKTPKDSCDKRIKQVIEYFHTNLDSDIRLRELALMADCTEFHLIRLFRDHKGISPHAFLVQIRLEHARSLLEKGAAIATAALSSGFADQSHLTRRFKSRYGITPHAYKTACCPGYSTGSQ